MEHALSVHNLSVRYRSSRHRSTVDSVSLEVGVGEIVGLIGESGSGKSTLALSCLGLLPDSASLTAERMDILGRSAVGGNSKTWRSLRKGGVGYVGQDPFDALNPVLRIGAQIGECLRGLPRSAVQERVTALLQAVELPAEIRRSFPDELSGGMRQRVAIAIALANSPSLLVADEPTTALDVTTQEEILNLLVRLRSSSGMAVLVISHDLGVIGRLCDRLYVMYRGKIVESGRTRDIIVNPQHPYTIGLIRCARLDRNEHGTFYELPRELEPEAGQR